MSNRDPSGWTERDGPADDWSGRGRYRARHADAAPDPYPDGEEPSGDPYGWDQAAAAWDTHDRYGGYSTDEVPPADFGLWREEPEPPPQPQPQQPPRRAEPPAQPPPSGRAGRNLPAAIGIGLLLGAVVVGSLFLYRPSFLLVIAAAVAVGTWEMVRAVQPSGAKPPLIPLLVGGAAMQGLAWFFGPDALAIGLLLTVLAAMVWRLADGPAGYHRDITAGTLIAVYVPFLAGFASLLAAPSDGEWRVLVTLLAVVLSDTGGYVAGVFFGKRPLAPTVSPKKSWEGLIGSLVATGAGSAASLYFVLGVDWWWGLLFGVVVSVASVLGDLAESLLKRDLGIKDMSHLLPGHGGLMDRLDSILFAAPAAYLLLSLLVPAPV